MIPMVVGWKWYPDKRGWVTGAVVSAYGFSSFLFTNLSTAIVNPDGHNADEHVEGKLYYFKTDVSERVPMML